MLSKCLILIIHWLQHAIRKGNPVCLTREKVFFSCIIVELFVPCSEPQLVYRVNDLLLGLIELLALACQRTVATFLLQVFKQNFTFFCDASRA